MRRRRSAMSASGTWTWNGRMASEPVVGAGSSGAVEVFIVFGSFLVAALLAAVAAGGNDPSASASASSAIGVAVPECFLASMVMADSFFPGPGSRPVSFRFEKAADIAGESLGVLKQEGVAAVGVDRQLTVGNFTSENRGVDRREQLVPVAVGDQRRNLDLLQPDVPVAVVAVREAPDRLGLRCHGRRRHVGGGR